MTIRSTDVQQSSYRTNSYEFAGYHVQESTIINSALSAEGITESPDGYVLVRFKEAGSGVKRKILPLITLPPETNMEKVPALDFTWDKKHRTQVKELVDIFIADHTDKPEVGAVTIRPLAYIEKHSRKLHILNTLLISVEADYSTTGVTPRRKEYLHFLLTLGKDVAHINTDKLTLARSSNESVGVRLTPEVMGVLSIVSNLEKKDATLPAEQQLRNAEVNHYGVEMPVIIKIRHKDCPYKYGWNVNYGLSAIEKFLSKEDPA